MKLFGQLVRMIINTVTLPVAVVKDIVTLGNVTEPRTYTRPGYRKTQGRGRGRLAMSRCKDCKIGSRTGWRTYEIQFCPLHASAAETAAERDDLKRQIVNIVDTCDKLVEERDALRQVVVELEPRAAFGDQCYQDHCENAYVEQTVYKRLSAEWDVIRDQHVAQIQELLAERTLIEERQSLKRELNVLEHGYECLTVDRNSLREQLKTAEAERDAIKVRVKAAEALQPDSGAKRKLDLESAS